MISFMVFVYLVIAATVESVLLVGDTWNPKVGRIMARTH